MEQLDAGDRIRTGLGAGAGVAFDDGTVLQLGPDASFVIEEASDKAMRVRLDLGSLRAAVQPQAAGKFEMRTPTALLRVRGTDFEVKVLAGGRTLVELYQGALAVEDNVGNQTLLKPNERLQIDLRGLQAPERRPSRFDTASAEFRALAHAEAARDAARERERSATGRDLRLAELQQGRALVDVNGRRVRVEEFIARPDVDRFRYVALNSRGGRTDYFTYQGTFNRSLPADLSVALAQLSGCLDRQCDWFLTEFKSVRSNLVDSVVTRGVNTIGGQIDVNANGSLQDDVTTLFDGSRERFIDVTGRSVFRTIFNQYGVYLNGKLLIGASGGNNITSESDRQPVSVTDPFTGAALTNNNAWLLAGQLVTQTANANTAPAANKAHQQIYQSYDDGSFLQYDNYSLDPGGHVAASSAIKGSGVLNFAYQQVITSSRFSGRKIDLVVAPKILVQAGLLQ